MSFINRNVTIVVIILVLVVIAGYLVWLRSRYQQPVTALPQTVTSPSPLLSPSPSPEMSATPSATPKTTLKQSGAATSGATKR